MKPLLFSFLMAAVSPIALASGNQASCIDNVTASCQERASEYWDSGVTSKMRQGNTVYAQCLNDGFETMLRSQGASDDSIAKIFGLLDEHKKSASKLYRELYCFNECGSMASVQVGGHVNNVLTGAMRAVSWCE